MKGSGGNRAAGRDTALDPRPGADIDPVENRALEHARARAEASPSENGALGHDVGGTIESEDPRVGVESAASFGEGKTARERFERRAEKIARAAEVGEAPRVPHPGDRSAPAEQRLPEVGDERRLSARNAVEKARREDADAGVEERGWAFAAESRDAIPFGLQRRVPARLAVLDDEERRVGTSLEMPRQEDRGIERDRGIRVDHEKVVAGQPVPRVSQRAGGPEDLPLPEELELRKLARMLAEVALDLVSEVMKIDARLANARSSQTLEMSDDERDVQEGK